MHFADWALMSEHRLYYTYVFVFYSAVTKWLHSDGEKV